MILPNFLFRSHPGCRAGPCEDCRLAERGTRIRGLAGNYAFDREQNGAFFAVMLQYRMQQGKAIPSVAKKYDFTRQ